MEEIVIATTRNYQKAEYTTTTVSVVDEAEVEEASHDKLSDVSHVVKEQPDKHDPVTHTRIKNTKRKRAFKVIGYSIRNAPMHPLR